MFEMVIVKTLSLTHIWQKRKTVLRMFCQKIFIMENTIFIVKCTEYNNNQKETHFTFELQMYSKFTYGTNKAFLLFRFFLHYRLFVWLIIINVICNPFCVLFLLFLFWALIYFSYSFSLFLLIFLLENYKKSDNYIVWVLLNELLDSQKCIFWSFGLI